MSEHGLSPEVREALRAFGEATQTERVSDAAWQRAVQGAEAPRGWQLGLGFACACALGAVATAAVMSFREPVRSPPQAPAAKAIVAASPGALLHRDGEHWVLSRGSIRLTTRGTPQKIKTSQLEVAALDARFLVDAIDGRTMLFVEEGSVTWRDERGEHVALAGTRIEVPPPTEAAAAEPERHGLAEQTTLYEQGLRDHQEGKLDEAMSHFREYRRQFPAGVFAPEACMALMLEARAVGRLDEARALADEFLRDFSSDPRAADVAAWREQLR